MSLELDHNRKETAMPRRRFCENCGYTAPHYRFNTCERCNRLVCGYCRSGSQYFCDHGNPPIAESLADDLTSECLKRHTFFRSLNE